MSQLVEIFEVDLLENLKFINQNLILINENNKSEIWSLEPQRCNIVEPNVMLYYYEELDNKEKFYIFELSKFNIYIRK